MYRHQLVPVLALAVTLGAVPARPCQAQWRVNGAPVCTAVNDQEYPGIVSDGAGGAIVTWQDFRSGTNWAIYAQRVSADGVPQWATDGTALCNTTGSKGLPTMIVSDGAGGAIVTWHEYGRNDQYAHIYAQRVSAAGVPQWATDGMGVCTAAPGNQYFPAIASDGAGGAIVAWLDSRSGPNVGDYAVYTQRVNGAGVPQWTANGVALCTTGYFPSLSIVSDGAGGAIVTWLDFRSGTNYAIYTQRVDAAGVPQWTADGVALCTTATFTTPGPKIASDGAGGAIVTWVDTRVDTATHIYAQRVSPSGAPQWTTDGVALCTAAPNGQNTPMIVSDGAGGAIVTWEDDRGADYDIYAQRVSADGVPQWTADGVALCTAGNNQLAPALVSDGAGGAIVTWGDQRSGYINGYNVYAQRVNAAGVPQWTPDGAALYTADPSGGIPTITSDAAGGAIVTWHDARSGTRDIYAQRLGSDGPVPVELALVTAEAEPDRVQLTWYGATASGLEATVYRGTEPTRWEPLGTVIGDGTGTLRYEDRTVSAGTRYAYRLGYTEGGREVLSVESWVQVPPGFALTLEGFRPNPAIGGAIAAFTLPTAEPTTLELLDLTGRRVLSREVGSLGAGQHTLRLEGTVPAGVYWIRLRQGTHSQVARGVVMR